MRADLRDHKRTIEELGIRLINTSLTGSQHYKFTCEMNGEQRFFIAPCSGSDQRNLQNFKSQLKRWQRSLLP